MSIVLGTKGDLRGGAIGGKQLKEAWMNGKRMWSNNPFTNLLYNSPHTVYWNFDSNSDAQYRDGKLEIKNEAKGIEYFTPALGDNTKAAALNPTSTGVGTASYYPLPIYIPTIEEVNKNFAIFNITFHIAKYFPSSTRVIVINLNGNSFASTSITSSRIQLFVSKDSISLQFYQIPMINGNGEYAVFSSQLSGLNVIQGWNNINVMATGYTNGLVGRLNNRAMNKIGDEIGEGRPMLAPNNVISISMIEAGIQFQDLLVGNIGPEMGITSQIKALAYQTMLNKDIQNYYGITF